jgi:gag-polyprotein putative aspartyl protease
MIVTPFDPTRDLIYVTATIWSPRGTAQEATMVFDPGAAITLISPVFTDALGYGAHLSDRRTVVRSAIGSEPGYLMRVARFAALGLELADFSLHVHDLPDDDIHGLLGLDFLRRLDFDVRPARGEIRTRPASHDA